ncbi:ATP-dependent helicase [Allomuricauda taeanensis]|uniref:ATP-dependent helicase n=1 Tax=Flagellimonas taeanensis TaxID=1005926 RepID=UPI002E7C3D7A|nr:ATP-dependent helicase [Allomuricauda taeanensis]MEE1964314.1 ATP-dependent helicase [Allomuricauda taeanensis]
MSFTPTPQQKQIFEFFQNGKGHGMIDAVAGSGKTTTIIKGIDYIDKNTSILFCAFNKKIQLEIHKKTIHNQNVIVRTTYALGLNILRHHFNSFRGKNPNSSKYYNILNEKLKRLENSHDYANPSKFTNVFDLIRASYYSNKKRDEPDVFYKTFLSNFYRLVDLSRFTLSYSKGKEKFKSLVEKYSIDIDQEDSGLMELYQDLVEIAIDAGNKQARIDGVFDFPDMIFLPCELKLRSPNKYDVLFVDECQDLSNAQLKTIRKYLAEGGRLFAVGDPFQSIYGFAGASPKSFDNIREIFQPKMFSLTNCFRCDKSIIDLAKEIRNDIETSSLSKGETLKIKFNQVSKLATETDLILSRHNADLFETVFELLKMGVKCKILGKTEILKGLKDILPSKHFEDEAYYSNLIDNLEKLYHSTESKMQDNPTNFEKLVSLRDSINVIETCYFNTTDCSTLNELFDYIETLMDCEDEESVILSSIHRAKGLESNRVFIIGYENLPFKKEGMKDWQLYQEKCLKYVAITRAKHTLFLSEPIPDSDDFKMKDFETGLDSDGECELDDDIDFLPI